MDQNYERYVKDLPVIPEVALKILRIAEDSPDISSGELENIIKIDPGLAARILKISNSKDRCRASNSLLDNNLGFTCRGFQDQSRHSFILINHLSPLNVFDLVIVQPYTQHPAGRRVNNQPVPLPAELKTGRVNLLQDLEGLSYRNKAQPGVMAGCKIKHFFKILFQPFPVHSQRPVGIKDIVGVDKVGPESGAGYRGCNELFDLGGKTITAGDSGYVVQVGVFWMRAKLGVGFLIQA